LTSLSERYNKNIDWLKNYLKYNLVKVGKEKLKTDRFSINVSNRKPKLVINEELLSSNYKYEETKTVTKINRDKISDDINNGVIIEGVTLEEVKALTIR